MIKDWEKSYKRNKQGSRWKESCPTNDLNSKIFFLKKFKNNKEHNPVNVSWHTDSRKKSKILTTNKPFVDKEKDKFLFYI